MKNVMSFYAIKNHFQYKVTKFCGKEYSLNCLDDNCKWKFKASKKGNTNIFIVRKFNDIHNCSLENRLHAQRQATTVVIGECIKVKYLSIKTVYTPADILRDMKEEYGITMNYQKITNPGSVAEIKARDDNRFEYAFMALDASIKGWKYCRPVMVVDGTFLKSTYGGTMLTAIAQNASGKLFPLAFCIADSENNASWEWFFVKIKQAFGVREGLTIISNRCDSIANTINEVYPEATHGICMFHLFNILKTKFKRNARNIKDSFFGAARSYTKDRFEYHMSELDEENKSIRPYLESVGYEKWTRAFCESNRYSVMTSNLAESFNAATKAARELPIATLLEYLRSLTQQWSVTNRSIGEATFIKISRQAEAMLEENTIQSLKLSISSTRDILPACNCSSKRTSSKHLSILLSLLYQRDYVCDIQGNSNTQFLVQEHGTYLMKRKKLSFCHLKERFSLEDQKRVDTEENGSSSSKIIAVNIERNGIIRRHVEICQYEIV
ncbi:uncharacterized protein LOC126672668 [Mercurialis annua]|uniref:uncharacterized protein LOC126672668 n=1 Tax=Mercurialis annua TaxID=3986 RepID=UPI002160D6DD|nr:uncharacterized protein LOC126672668 [Mercurialis annua]